MTGFPSREELLGGLSARRATTLLFAIESRTAQIVAEARRALVPRVTQRSIADEERAFLAAIAAGRVERPVRVQDLERYADRWRDLMPDDQALKAELGRLILEKYRVPATARRLRAVLALGDAAPFARQLSLRERFDWLRSRLADRVERMPPFWIAYAFTLTETVGGGILALPIVLAGLGPGVALVFLGAFGVVNIVTVAALCEAITRNGHMRYGTAYFGRLVVDYLGQPGLIVFTLALTGLLCVVLLFALIGFADILSGATGTHPALWAAALFAVTIVVIRRGSLDATIASAILIGAVNLVVLLVIALVAFASARSRGSEPISPLQTGVDPTALALVFGVLLTAYFGHLSAGNVAKLVLARDPGGRSLLWGNVLAMASVIVVYGVVITAIFLALDERVLVGHSGTVLQPLADAVGPIIHVLGAVYAPLAFGLVSLYYALGLYNLAGEAIRPLAARLGKRGPALLGSPGVRFVLGAAPIVAVFVLVEILLLTDAASFSGPLGVIGTLAVPILSGIFPMLLVAAARRRGNRVPQSFFAFIGRAPVIGLLWLMYVTGIAIHIVIWPTIPEKLLAIAATAASMVVTYLILRGGALRRSASLELRQDAEPAAPLDVSLVADGRTVDVPLETSAPDGLRVRLPALDVPALRLWAHRVTPADDSAALDVTARVGDHAIVLDEEGEAVVPLEGQPVTVDFNGLPAGLNQQSAARSRS